MIGSVGFVLLVIAPLVELPRAMPDPAVTAARLDALVLRLTGNAEELRAAELVAYHHREERVAACMRDAGRPYRKRPFVSFYENFTDADLGYGTGRGTAIDSLTEGGRRHLQNELAYARAEHWHTLQPRLAPEQWQAIATCRRESAPEPDVPLGSNLAGFPGLADAAGLNPAVLGAMRSYHSCMRTRYGYKVPRERTDFLFRPWFSRDDAPIPGYRAARPEWTRGVAEMRAAFAADAECRRPAYVRAMAIVAAGLPVWERLHRKEIKAIRAVWRQRVAEARVLRQG